MELLSILLMVATILKAVSSQGILYPRESETREVKSLDGIWKFNISEDVNTGFDEKWYTSFHNKWMDMPVPASYNDITVKQEIRDFVGWAWYQTQFYAPNTWKQANQRVFLRFGAASYYTNVWLNGQFLGEHVGGHLPFLFEVTGVLQYSQPNLLTVAINNTLTNTTLPQGTVTHTNNTMRYPPGYVIYDYSFDFFNYAGIHRPVYLYATPQSFIDDISVTTTINGSTGIVKYSVESIIASNGINEVKCVITLLDDSGSVVAKGLECQDELTVENPTLWWPVNMNDTVGYLYTLQAQLLVEDIEDIYRLPIGIRTLSWDDGLRINDVPIYLRGFGKHEDSDIRGKGLDYALLLRDHNLLDWIGANAYRTSHYPYAEETMDLADSRGIMIIDESPAVNLDVFDETMLNQHKAVMAQMVKRDKNRPSIIMWSVSNEARSSKEEAGPYYKELVQYVKGMDPTRPVTVVTNGNYEEDRSAEHVDVIGLNRYPSWYSDPGMLQLVTLQVENEITAWHDHHNKSIYVSEYGADSVIGIHSLPVSVWTEDYQAAVLYQYFAAFDNLREKGFFVGELIWNFADFATKQDITRVVGNRKGVFTRQRQPKEAAYALKNRYHRLNAIIP